VDKITLGLRANITPQIALEMLKDGNRRFTEKNRYKRDLHKEVNKTREGQFPFAAILGCIDSRVPSEYIFDAGFGDILNVRVAGNIVNEDVLGSLEYSCYVAGAKLILVLGHTDCGAINAACQQLEMGNITPLLRKIKPAVDMVTQTNISGNIDEDAVAEKNVFNSIDLIMKGSSILSDMVSKGKILIKGAMYDVTSGKVRFL